MWPQAKAAVERPSPSVTGSRQIGHVSADWGRQADGGRFFARAALAGRVAFAVVSFTSADPGTGVSPPTGSATLRKLPGRTATAVGRAGGTGDMPTGAVGADGAAAVELLAAGDGAAALGAGCVGECAAGEAGASTAGEDGSVVATLAAAAPPAAPPPTDTRTGVVATAPGFVGFADLPASSAAFFSLASPSPLCTTAVGASSVATAVGPAAAASIAFSSVSLFPLWVTTISTRTGAAAPRRH